ncbi:MAG: winged helix-turn-helix domain-containing protein [Lachnospiraceae bacterium]|nr:winged helix-turn-helix domain-containing protein [Lachnospiraceae bacterium]
MQQIVNATEKKADYHITMLGEFSIAYKNHRVYDQSNRSKKPWNLLEYLITYKDKDISQKELIDLLWAGETSDNPAGALKVLLHRVRKSLEEIEPESGEELIILKRGNYKWNPNLSCSIDADVFDELCTKAADDTLPRDERIELYKRAFDLYKGDFLPRNSHESWVIPIASYYHQVFIKSVFAYIEILEDESRFSDIETITRHALTIDPLDEKLYYHLIQALYKSGKQQEALQQYSTATDLFYKKFGITPSDELKSLYRVVVRTTKSLETDISTIKEALREKGEASGAFMCEYEFFKDIYQLEARACARSGDSIYLCLITINKLSGDTPSIKALNRSMDDLLFAINETLRKGDVVSRYSVSQYVLMLPTTTYENVEMIMKRITSSFYRKYVKKDVTLQYKLQPLDPMM